MTKPLKSKRKIIRHKKRRYKLDAILEDVDWLRSTSCGRKISYSDLPGGMETHSYYGPGSYLIYKQIESKEGKRCKGKK